MDGKRRRELALAGVAVLLVAIAAWSMQRGTASPAGAAVPDGTARPNTAQRPKSPIPEVDLKALDIERPAPDDSTRNPFRFKPRPAPPTLPSAAMIKQQQAAAAAQAASQPSEPAPPPRIPLKYIGDMSESETLWKENRDSE